MDAPQRSAVSSLLPRLLARLRHPHLFLLLLALFLVDLVMPDVIPFLDEIVLAILTLLLGSWRKPPEGEPPAPPPPALPRS
jgi:hypothetical protein